MGGLDRLDDRLWDRLCDFIEPDVAQMSSAEIDAELASARLDIEPVFRRVREALASAAARRSLAEASQRRQLILKALADVVVGPIQDVRGQVCGLIQTLVPAVQQGVYFRKLDQIATDEDMRSLLEDIERLAILERELGASATPRSPSAES